MGHLSVTVPAGSSADIGFAAANDFGTGGASNDLSVCRKSLAGRV
jgi:hypothetical protein